MPQRRHQHREHASGHGQQADQDGHDHVPVSRPRRDPGPSILAATVDSALPAVTVSATANTAVTAAAGPSRIPCTSTVLSAMAASAFAGSSSPTSRADGAVATVG